MSATVKVNPLARPTVNPFSDIFYPESDGQPMAESDKHRDLILELIDTLKRHFAERTDVYVTGNILVYYTEGVVQDSVAPDVMVVFGVTNEQRRSYFLWKEEPPTVILEIGSHSTWKIDRQDKRLLYETLGVKEYFLFNPDYPKRTPAWMAFRRSAADVLEAIEIKNGRVYSQYLDLEIVDTGDTLRLFNPQTGEFLLNSPELARKAEVMTQKAEEMETRAVAAETENSALAARVAELEAKLKNQN